jgi:hypothetical protein
LLIAFGEKVHVIRGNDAGAVSLQFASSHVPAPHEMLNAIG